MKPTIKVYRIKLDCQGYDKHGRYWGLGPKLYRVCWEADTSWPHVTYERGSYQAIRAALKPHGKVLR